jgi:hypothetical protein
LPPMALTIRILEAPLMRRTIGFLVTLTLALTSPSSRADAQPGAEEGIVVRDEALGDRVLDQRSVAILPDDPSAPLDEMRTDRAWVSAGAGARTVSSAQRLRADRPVARCLTRCRMAYKGGYDV